MKNKEFVADHLSDILANMEDWSVVKDFKTVFIESAEENEPGIDLAFLSTVYDNYMSLSVVERHQPEFNHKNFVLSQINKFENKQE